MAFLLTDEVDFPAAGAFALVTFLSCISILASVGLMNLVSRDWALEVATNEELTSLNSWMRGIDQACMIIACGLAGLAISYNKAFGAGLIAGFNIIAMIFQGIMLIRVYNMIPSLQEPRKQDVRPSSKELTCTEKITTRVKQPYESWEIFFKCKVALPGFVLGVLYVNILGMGYPLQGYGRQVLCEI